MHMRRMYFLGAAGGKSFERANLLRLADCKHPVQQHTVHVSATLHLCGCRWLGR